MSSHKQRLAVMLTRVCVCLFVAVDDHTLSVPIITMLQLHLSGLVHSCLLLGDRAVAHKASRIIVTALE